MNYFGNHNVQRQFREIGASARGSCHFSAPTNAREIKRAYRSQSHFRTGANRHTGTHSRRVRARNCKIQIGDGQAIFWLQEKPQITEALVIVQKLARHADRRIWSASRARVGLSCAASPCTTGSRIWKASGRRTCGGGSPTARATADLRRFFCAGTRWRRWIRRSGVRPWPRPCAPPSSLRVRSSAKGRGPPARTRQLR